MRQAGKPWVAIEWLAECLYASAYRLGGYSGVAALVTAALMALHAVVFLNAAGATTATKDITLADSADFQPVKVSADKVAQVRFEIASVHQSAQGGHQVSIAELEFFTAG